MGGVHRYNQEMQLKREGNGDAELAYLCDKPKSQVQVLRSEIEASNDDHVSVAFASDCTKRVGFAEGGKSPWHTCAPSPGIP